MSVFFWAKQQTNLSRQKTKKNTLSFLTSCLLFRSHFPLLRSFAPKKQKENRKISRVLETGKKNVLKTKRAQTKRTHARKKKELARIKSTDERVQVKVRDRFRPFFPLALLRVRREIARARVEISRERAPLFPFFRRIQKKNERVRFAHFQFAYIKRIHRAPKEVLANENASAYASLLIKENRAHQICAQKKRNSQKRRETRACSSAR